MNLLILTLLTFSPALLLGEQSSEEPQKLCEGVTLVGGSTISFTKIEKNLLCGDPKHKDWRRVPSSQASFAIKSFLETRGYLHAKVSKSKESGGITVTLGDKTLVNKIELQGEHSQQIPIEKFWKPIGNPLTPEVLDELESWTKQEYAERGYPCAEIASLASKDSGNIVVKANPGKKWRIGLLERDKIEGALPGVEERFDAFEVGHFYRSIPFKLTSRRLVANDLVISSSFNPICSRSEDRLIRHSLITSKPRLISFGFGFDSEEFFIAKALWQHGRLGNTASKMQVSGSFSWRRQTIRSVFDWYLLPFPSRFHIRNDVKAERLVEDEYEARVGQISSLPSWQGNLSPHLNLTYSLGLQYELQELPRGYSFDSLRLIGPKTSIELASEHFEYFKEEPQKGFMVRASSTYAGFAFGSDIEVGKAEIATKQFFNLGGWIPPVAVLGIRSTLASTWRGENSDFPLPPPGYLWSLGGSENMRGFGRRAISNQLFPVWSKFYLGSEVRFLHTFSYGIQPLFLLDYGLTGDSSFKLDLATSYWSPGIGIRWQSPIGIVRTTLANGYVSGEKKEELHYKQSTHFYLSLGQDF